MAKVTTGSSNLNPISLATPVGGEHFFLNNYNKSHRKASPCSGLCYVPTPGAGDEVRLVPKDKDWELVKEGFPKKKRGSNTRGGRIDARETKTKGLSSLLVCVLLLNREKRSFVIKSRRSRGQNIWAIVSLDLMRRAEIGNKGNKMIQNWLKHWDYIEESCVMQKINFWREGTWIEAAEKKWFNWCV